MKTDEVELQLKIALPAIKAHVPTIAMVNSFYMLAMAHHKDCAWLAAYTTLANAMLSDDFRYKMIRKYASNNWLKMHGYPMRRRRRGR